MMMIWQTCHFRADFDRSSWWEFWTLFNILTGQLTFITETFKLFKRIARYVSCFNEIRRICCVNTHIEGLFLLAYPMTVIAWCTWNTTAVICTDDRRRTHLLSVWSCYGAVVNQWRADSQHTAAKGKGSPYSITERRVPELIPVLDSQPAGDVSHKPGGKLPLLSARPAVTRNP